MILDWSSEPAGEGSWSADPLFRKGNSGVIGDGPAPGLMELDVLDSPSTEDSVLGLAIWSAK